MDDLKTQLRTYLDETPAITFDEIVEERLGEGDVRPMQPRTPVHRARVVQRGPAWVTAVGAFSAVLAFGGVAWLLFGGGDSAPTIATSALPSMPGAATPASPATTVASGVTVAPVTWNPILATTSARQAPPAATCPPGTDPNRSGPSDQARPESVPNTGLSAAFDRHTGRIVYIDAGRMTWTFDVCTNSWHEMDPAGVVFPPLGDLIYDVDSDLTVMFGADSAYVYDAASNTWTADSGRSGTGPDDSAQYGVEHGLYPVGAVYDPVSGLIIATTMVADDGWAVWAYDVDTGAWTPVGEVALDRTTPCCTQIDLLGYSPELDRLILTTYGEDRSESRFVRDIEELTLLLDPRTGSIEPISTPSPIVDLAWLAYSYGQAADTVFVNGWAPDAVPSRRGARICGFDPGALEWSRCFDAPTGLQAQGYPAYAAMVDDSINHRLTLINGLYGEWWSQTDAAVWAIDLRSGDTLTLVAPAAAP
jgi:hypothetical protein